MDRVLIDLAQGTSGIRVQAGTGGPGWAPDGLAHKGQEARR